MTRARVSGDYLQTAAIFDQELRVLSAVTDPNDYAGPGTGYEPSPPRQAQIDGIRQARGVDDLRAEQASAAELLLAPASGPGRAGPAGRGDRRVARRGPGRLAFAVRAARARGAGRAAGRAGGGGLRGRVVRFNDTIDLGRIGLAAARLAGSGIGIGLQGKGTALIHRRDLAPLANLELYSWLPPSPASCTGCSAPTRPGTPRAPPRSRSGTRTPTRPSRPVPHRGGRLVALERGWLQPGEPAEQLSKEGLQ